MQARRRPWILIQLRFLKLPMPARIQRKLTRLHKACFFQVLAQRIWTCLFALFGCRGDIRHIRQLQQSRAGLMPGKNILQTASRVASPRIRNTSGTAWGMSSKSGSWSD